MNFYKICILDSDELFTSYLESLLLTAGYNNIIIINGLNNFSPVSNEVFDILFVCNKEIASSENQKIINQYQEKFNSAIIYLLNKEDIDLLESIPTMSYNSFVLKPVKKAHLVTSIEYALHKKKINTDLLETKKRLDSFIMNLSEAVIVVNKNNKINFINDKALEYLNLHEDECMSIEIKKIFSPYHAKSSNHIEVSINLFQHIRHKIQYPYCHLTIHGKDHYISFIMMPISHEGGIITEYLINFQDISSSKYEIESYILSQSSQPKEGKWIAICSNCKKIFNEEEQRWLEVEHYLMMNESFLCSHTVCPHCAKKIYPSHYQDIFNINKSHKELRI